MDVAVEDGRTRNLGEARDFVAAQRERGGHCSCFGRGGGRLVQVSSSIHTAVMDDRTLTFIKHSDLDLLFTIKLASLEGTITTASLSSLLDHPHLKHAGAQQSIPSDIYVTVALYADNKVLCLPIRSSHKSFKSKANYVWNETIQFPIKYRDLPLSTQLVVNVYDIAGPLQSVVLGGSTLRLFGKKSTLKKGKQRLVLWKGVEGDGRVETGTSSKVGIKDEMGRLEKLVKKHENGDITRMDWLDKLAFRKIEQIHAVSTFDIPNYTGHTDMDPFYRANLSNPTICSFT